MAHCKMLIAAFATYVAMTATGMSDLSARVGGDATTLAPFLERITPAVVNISATANVNPTATVGGPTDFLFGLPLIAEPRLKSTGSGVIIDAKAGLIMTNSHLIQDADRIVVTLKDKRAYDASLIGMDTGTDIALLRIHANHLTELHLGDSDKLRVGDYIVAIGNPFGLGQTVSTGIVGALGLTQLGIEEYEDFIQTDASLNPGDSGGALVDMQGELIGINTTIYSVGGGNAGIGFAIPANLARASMDRLLKYGEVHRGWLGLRIEDLTPSIAPVMGVSVVEGAIVNEVFPDSPARKAGIRPGDVIISINGRSVRNAGHFRNEVGTMALGEIARVTVIRDEAKLGYSMRVEEQASTEPEPSGVEGTGLLAGARFKAGPDSASGVAIVDIEDGCALARAGLEAEDVIMSVNRRAVSGVDSLFEAFAAPGPFALRIRRDRSELFVVLR